VSRPVLLSFSLQLIATLLLASCLPIPNHVRDTPRLHGQLLAGGVPIVGAKLALEPRPGLHDTVAVCSNAPITMQTDSTGAFVAQPHQHLELIMSFIGEAPEWHRPWHLCRGSPGPDRSRKWTLMYETWTNLWDSVRVMCDTTDSWRESSSSNDRGLCHEVVDDGTVPK